MEQQRESRWRERQRDMRPDFDPSGDGTAALMSRALPAPSTTEALDTAHGARRVEDEQFDGAGLTGFPRKSTEPRAGARAGKGRSPTAVKKKPRTGERGLYKFLLGGTVMGRVSRHRVDDTNLD